MLEAAQDSSGTSWCTRHTTPAEKNGNRMPLVIAKVLMAPVLVAVSTWVSRRWGGRVGGWLLGLPVTSGPVSVFLFVEHGAGFARSAARGALLGLVATAVFCVFYAAVAQRENWWRSLAGAYAACIGFVWLLSHTKVGFAASVLFALGALALLAWVIGAPESDEPVPAPAARGLTLRMLAASAAVYAITASAWLLGPTLAGLLAPLPIVAGVMTSAAHRARSGEATRGLLRGAVLGSWGGAGFFTVVGLMLGPVGPVVTYVAATGAALAGGAIAIKAGHAA